MRSFVRSLFLSFSCTLFFRSICSSGLSSVFPFSFGLLSLIPSVFCPFFGPFVLSSSFLGSTTYLGEKGDNNRWKSRRFSSIGRGTWPGCPLKSTPMYVGPYISFICSTFLRFLRNFDSSSCFLLHSSVSPCCFVLICPFPHSCNCLRTMGRSWKTKQSEWGRQRTCLIK